MELAALPPYLAEIQVQINAYQARTAQVEAQRRVWRAQSRLIQSSVPGVRLEASEESCTLGELSPGCRACHAGHWDCVFLTNQCNLACPFCYSPQQANLQLGSAFGSDPAQIIAGYHGLPIDGVSFSGGEPFLHPARLLEWAECFTRALPGAYFWVYTNGLLVEETHLAELGRLGVHEIRFDAAASGYDQPVLLGKLAAAARYLPNVTIEIPAIPEQAPLLLAALPAWAAAGVKYLNLHELMFEPGSLSANLPGDRQEVLLADGHRTAIHPLSRELTRRVMLEVERLGLALNVNDCSTAGKLVQVAGRRRLLAKRMQAAHERVNPEGLLETLAVSTDQQVFLIHPDQQASAAAAFSDATAYRLCRLSPLSPQEPPIWVQLEKLNWNVDEPVQ